MTEEPRHFCEEALAEAKSGNGGALVTKEEGNAVEANPAWPDVHERTGEPKKTYRNARSAIEALGIVCSHDEFHDRDLIGGHAIGIWAGQLSDAACCVLRQVIIDTHDFDPGKDNVNNAAAELCIENSFDPVVDYLDGLKWDGVGRLDAWVVTYLGAADTPLNRMIGKLTLVAAVRRARQPGCKFDHMTVLEGPEGKMKSTAILVLAGEDNFSDQTILAVGDREQQELVSGVWFYEIPELAGMRKAEIEKTKAFVTRTHDRARGAYRRHRTDAPRTCIFVGTTNEDTYLKSQTGNRRFWPLKITTIDIDALRRDRDQLFAEAGDRGGSRHRRWCCRRSCGATSRSSRKAVLSLILGTTNSPTSLADLYPRKGDRTEEWIKAQELLGTLGITSDRANTDTYKRLKRVMQRLGWEDGRHHFGGKKQQRGYFRLPQ